jgi:hypothetical protein
MTFKIFARKKTEPSEALWAFGAASKVAKVAETDVAPALFKPIEVSVRASDDAWRTLLFAHMPYHLPDQNQATRLTESLKSIEASDHEKKLRLMEQAYIILRLDRYANAPANRGWMNLFRAWSNEGALDAEFKRTEPQFNKKFVYFFVNDVRNRRPIDDDPIPHPWDDHDRSDSAFEKKIESLKKVALERNRERKRTRALEVKRVDTDADSEWWSLLTRRSNVFLDTGTIDPQGLGSTPSGPPLEKGSTAKEEQSHPEKPVEE